MEGLAIAVLMMILVVGGMIFFVFLQFLETARENHRLYEDILKETTMLNRKLDALSRPASQIFTENPPAS